MTEAASLLVTIRGQDVGAEALINRVRAAGQQADAALSRSGSNIGTNFGAGVNKASGSALALQQAQARLEAQQGNLVGSADRLRNALAQQGATTTQTIGAQRQLQAVEAQQAAAAERAGRAVLQEAVSLARLQQASGNTAGAIRTLTQAQGQLQAGGAAFNNLGASIARLSNPTQSLASQFTGSLKGSLLGIVGPAAAAGAALGVLSGVAGSFVDAFKFKAELDGTTASINSQLGSVRDMTTVWAEAEAVGAKYRITQQQTNEILANSTDVLRTSSASVADLEIALLRLGSRDPSKPISEAARALRELNAGDVTTIKELFNIGAADALKMKNEIQGGADAVQVLTAFLDKAGSGMNILEQRTTGALGAMNDLKLAQEDLTLAQAEFAQGPGLAILNARIEVTRGATRLLSGDTQQMGQSIAQASQEGTLGYNALIGALGPLGPALRTATDEAAAYNAAQQEAAQGGVVFGAAMDEERQAVQAATEAEAAAATIRMAGALTMDAERQAAAQASQAILELRAATDAGSAGTAQNTAALVDNIAQQQTGQIAGQQLAQVQATLAQLGGQVAQGFQTAGAAAQVLAAQYNIAYDAALALIQAQAQLAQAKLNAAALTDQRAGERDGGSSRTAAEVTFQANQARLAAASLKRRQEDAKKERGVGRAAGAAKLSDQAKLNNSLLADQEKYQDKAEQAALDHEQKLLDIEKQFQERSLQQQRANETGKRDSRGSFYRTLLLDTEGISPQVQQSLSAAYEAAFAKSQELAQSGNAKLAADYLALKNEQLSAEAQFQADLAKARADGDKDLIARLEAVRALEAQAAAEKEKQLLASGDADVAARDKALTEEEQRYAEAQGKMATAADSATERKIANAEREGKKVDELNLKYQKQVDLLNQTGGAAPGTASPGTLTPEGAPSTVSSPSASEGGGIAAALEGIITAVNAAKDAITAAQGNTTSAVKGLGSRLVG